MCRYQVPDDWPYQEARRLFKEPSVLSDEEQLDIKWSAPDEDVDASNLKFQTFYEFFPLYFGISFQLFPVSFLLGVDYLSRE